MRKRVVSLILINLVVLASAITRDVLGSEKIIVDSDQCIAILRSKSMKGVDYEPGIDVRGNEVRSAGIKGHSNDIFLPEELSFDISPKIFRLRSANAPSGLEDARVTIGTITLKSSGALYFGGQRLNARTYDEILTLCEARFIEKE